MAQREANDDDKEVADVEGHDGQHEQVGGGYIEGVQQAEQRSQDLRPCNPAQCELVARQSFKP